MQWLGREDTHLEQWIRVEHYRLHCAEQWPASAYKDAVIAAVHSTLKGFEAISLVPGGQLPCMPSRSKGTAAISRRAA